MKYIGRAIEEIKNKPGCWSGYKVGVFEVADDGTEKQVGEYIRHYHECIGEEVPTFCAFKQKGKWYALYSSDYTCTRVMTLPDCKDLCGEEGNSFGFCPVEYYVPTKEDLDHWNPIRLHNGKRESENDEYWEKLAISLKCHEGRDGSNYNAAEDAKKKRQWAREAEEFYLNIEDTAVGQFGFIAGCIWGDDSSLKLEYLDLSRISEGVFKREQRFGYFELPGKPLKECLDFDHFDGPSFTQIKALKSVEIPLMDRNWSEQEVGQIWKFADDSVFNGLKVRIKEWSMEGSVCEILESKNNTKDKEIYLEEYLFRYAKKWEG